MCLIVISELIISNRDYFKIYLREQGKTYDAYDLLTEQNISALTYKKYALPVACIVFVLIGAPLGIMVRRGGFGAAASISLSFFLLYWAFLIGGEKLAERDFFSPFIGMWAANILLFIMGIMLTIKTNKETVTIQFTFLKKLIPKKLRNR